MYNSLVTDESIFDYEKFFDYLNLFASNTFSSYGGYEVVDVSDVSIYFDSVAEYKFGSELHRDMFSNYATLTKKQWPT